jgi:hypothetical protein
MILIGNQRGGARDLARHLLKDENERVTVHDMRGFASDDLLSAFQESQAISRGTKCKQHLYSLSLNPPQDSNAGVEDFEDAIARAEKALGLEGQPRAIVFHEKFGADGKLRRHAHTVWCRIDTDNMRAVQLSFTRTKLQEVARGLYRDHDWQMPRGFVRHQERDPRNYSLAEWQQCKRAGRDPAKTKEIMQDAWAISDSRAAFANALKVYGLILARGDRRGHVAVDHHGEAYAVSRYVGLKAKQVRDRLGAPNDLPTKDEAHRTAAKRTTERLVELQAQQNRAAQNRINAFRAEHLSVRKQQKTEAARLAEKQQQQESNDEKLRQARVRKGFRGLVDWITGKRKQVENQNRLEAEQSNRQQIQERENLQKAQKTVRSKIADRVRTENAARKSVKKELSDDINHMKAAKPVREAQREEYVKKRKLRATRPRHARSRDGPTLNR